MVLAFPALSQKFAVLALQAQPQQVESIVDHLENSNDVGQFHLFQKNPKPRWRGKAKRALSPLSTALYQANNIMPEMWDPIPENCGVSRRDGKEASALLVFSHQALLLEKMAEQQSLKWKTVIAAGVLLAESTVVVGRGTETSSSSKIGTNLH
jgi:hypothetical protein